MDSATLKRLGDVLHFATSICRPIYYKHDTKPLSKISLYQKVNFVLYLVSIFIISKSLYYSYIYEYYLYHWKQTRGHNDQQVSLLLAQRLRKAREDLKQVGAILTCVSEEHPYAVTCVMLFQLVQSIVLNLTLTIEFRYLVPFDSYLFRLIRDRQREQERLNLLIANELEQVRKSSFNQYRNAANLAQGARKLADEPTVELKRHIADYEQTTRALERMSQDDNVQVTLRDADWIDRISYMYVVYNWFCYLGSSMAIFCVTLSLLVNLDTSCLQLGLADINVAICFSYLGTVITIACTYYLSINFLSLTDQTRMVDNLHAQIAGCVSRNTAHFLLIKDQPSTSLLFDRWRNQMNYELLLVLVKYRLFFEQLKTTQRQINIGTRTVILVVFAMPIIMRLHASYVDTQTKLAWFVLCLLINCACNFATVPLCNFHNRCLVLHRSLSSLLAHLAEVLGHRLALKLAPIYSEHTSYLLRQEHSLHPIRIARQFSEGYLMIDFNYRSLLRFTFWFSIIVLSSCFEYRSDQIFSNIFIDPLGIKLPPQLV